MWKTRSDERFRRASDIFSIRIGLHRKESERKCEAKTNKKKIQKKQDVNDKTPPRHFICFSFADRTRLLTNSQIAFSFFMLFAFLPTKISLLSCDLVDFFLVFAPILYETNLDIGETMNSYHLSDLFALFLFGMKLKFTSIELAINVKTSARFVGLFASCLSEAFTFNGQIVLDGLNLKI